MKSEGGQNWMPITPPRGSNLHAETQSAESTRKRVIWRVVERTDLVLIETRLVNFQHRPTLLTAWHVFYCETEGLGSCLEPPIARAAYSSFRLAGVKSSSARIVEPGHICALAVATG